MRHHGALRFGIQAEVRLELGREWALVMWLQNGSECGLVFSELLEDAAQLPLNLRTVNRNSAVHQQ